MVDINMSEISLSVRRPQAALVVVDLQERLVPAMFERERVVQNAIRLAKGAAALSLPAWITEQYRKGLGATLAEIAAPLPKVTPVDKVSFSACGAPGFTAGLQSTGIEDVILCGVESHVCVCQTCLDLLESGFRPFVVADAVSSRTPENWRAGLDRMRASGAVIVTTEMILFELVQRAGTDEFKQVQALIK